MSPTPPGHSSPSRSRTASRSAWPCCGRFWVPEVPLSDRPAELFVRDGRVVDERGERAADVRVVDGVVAEVGASLTPSAGATVLDAEGCIVAPGLVDLQVHFREPGREEAET